MKLLKIFVILILTCTSLAGCIHNTTGNEVEESMKFGKNITIIVFESEMIDSTYLQNVHDGTVKKDYPYFDLLNDDDFVRLIGYMADNNYMVKPGTYTFNQAWEFDNGEFILNNGERRKIFEFQQQSE